MKPIFSNRFFPRQRNFARLFILLVSTLFFFSVSSLAESDSSGDLVELQQILQVLNWALKDSVSGSTGRIPEQLDDIFEYDQAAYKFLTGRTTLSNSLNYNDKNALPYLLGSVVYGLTGWAPNSSQPLDYSLHGDLTTGNQTLAQLLALLHNISNVVAQSASTVVVSNFVSVTNSGGGVASPAILAANPWWSTNSAFVLSSANLGLEYPHDLNDNPGLFSFPEFLSAWSSRLQSPYSRPTVAQLRDFDSWWGMDAYLKQSSISEKITRNYTWFDWMADSMRTNKLLQSSLIRAMLGTSNEVWNSANYVVNQLESSLGDSNFYLSNVVSVLTGISSDILAGNPWWYTNSAFAWDWDGWIDILPPPNASPGNLYSTSFPEIFSILLSSRTRDISFLQPSDYWGLFGSGGDNTLFGLYTFEDWLADYLKSNLVLTTSSSYSNLVAEVSQYDTSDDSNPTNVPLPEYSLPDSETIPAASDTLTSAEVGITEKIETLQPNYTGGDDEIVVIPAFSVGGINVPEYRARLGTSITPVCRRVASFIWYVGLFAFLFAFAKTEFVYYATLGKFWVKVG